jgi:hypothetical protein
MFGAIKTMQFAADMYARMFERQAATPQSGRVLTITT